jgi:hypothetical protein
LLFSEANAFIKNVSLQTATFHPLIPYLRHSFGRHALPLSRHYPALGKNIGVLCMFVKFENRTIGASDTRMKKCGFIIRSSVRRTGNRESGQTGPAAPVFWPVALSYAALSKDYSSGGFSQSPEFPR